MHVLTCHLSFLFLFLLNKGIYGENNFNGIHFFLFLNRQIIQYFTKVPYSKITN